MRQEYAIRNTQLVREVCVGKRTWLTLALCLLFRMFNDDLNSIWISQCQCYFASSCSTGSFHNITNFKSWIYWSEIRLFVY